MKHEITMAIDDASLVGYSDKFLATAWHAVQRRICAGEDREIRRPAVAS
jgi:hypothetical protein